MFFAQKNFSPFRAQYFLSRITLIDFSSPFDANKGQGDYFRDLIIVNPFDHLNDFGE